MSDLDIGLRRCFCGGHATIQYSPSISDEGKPWCAICVPIDVEDQHCAYVSDDYSSFAEAADDWNKRSQQGQQGVMQ